MECWLLNFNWADPSCEVRSPIMGHGWNFEPKQDNSNPIIMSMVQKNSAVYFLLVSYLRRHWSNQGSRSLKFRKTNGHSNTGSRLLSSAGSKCFLERRGKCVFFWSCRCKVFWIRNVLHLLWRGYLSRMKQYQTHLFTAATYEFSENAFIMPIVKLSTIGYKFEF